MIDGALVALALLAAPSAAPVPSEPAATLLFVAPAGDDRWSGRLPEPNPDRSDGPLATLTGARDAIRRLRAAAAPAPVTVRVRGGTYRMAAPFVLEPQDSGASEAPIVYEAFPGERPVLSGGRVLDGFRKNGGLWETTIEDVRAGKWYFQQLFAGGARRVRARSPDDGYFRIADPAPALQDKAGKELPPGRWGFGFAPGDLKPWPRLEDAVVVLMHSWENSIHPIQSIDMERHVVTFRAPLKEWWTIGYWERRQRYFVENVPEALDQPGEWHLDRRTGVLRYWPRAGEEVGKVEIVAPALTELVRIAGKPDEGRLVAHVALKGLAFHHVDWEMSPRGNSSTQAAVEVPAAIVADGAAKITIERCEVAHVGTYGIWLRRGCKECWVARNRLFDLGAGGIRVGETEQAKEDAAESSRNQIDNNHIFDGGHVFPAGVGVWVAQSSYNRISHNEIHDLRYSGISMGWNWNDAPNRCHHNVIEFNHVHHLVNGVLSDAGAIYTLGVSPGSIIRRNVFHDVWPYETPPFGWGIYLDATTGGYLVENNVVYNIRSGGLMFSNGGHENIFQNNIFALTAEAGIWPFWEPRPNTFRRNIVFMTQGQLFIPFAEGTLEKRIGAGESLGVWDENIYWHSGEGAKLRFFRRTFEEWQSLGLDRGSRIADPRFVAPNRYDFTLEADSPALALGFKPINTSTVGLYGDPAWVAEARSVTHPPTRLPPPPPPPTPIEIDDGFETTAIGAPPAGASVSGEEKGASIRVTGEKAAAGARSLKIVDAQALEPSWQPHFFYSPHQTKGRMRQAFDVLLETGTSMFTEWRDERPYPACIGPSVAFGLAGKIVVRGKEIATVPPGQWIHIEIEATLGEEAPRTFALSIQVTGAPAPQLFRDLPFAGETFEALEWLGFSSTAAADTAFYLDNVSVRRISP